jgi:hypothetical protein
VDDPEYEDDAILIEDVIHHAVIPDAESIKRVCEPLDRLDRLASDPTGSRRVISKPLECIFDPGTNIGR